ncbi:MAG: aminomethyl transferase family protein [Alphaproteobacteria bacterium]|nr:aminomethyl transferase family protein [Alphaproteobacteria bacterium]
MIPRLKVTAHNEPGWNYNLWKSAFHPITERLGAGYMVYNQRIVPVSFNDDRMEGYWALRRDAIVIDASAEKAIEIAGPDAEAPLDRAMTRDLTRLKPGRALYALVFWKDGGLVSDGVLLRLAHDRFWYVSGCGEVQAWLTALGMGMNVRVSDPDVSVLAIQGPEALDVLAAAIP